MAKTAELRAREIGSRQWRLSIFRKLPNKKGLPPGKPFPFTAQSSVPQRFSFTSRIRATFQRRFPLRILDPHDGLGAAGHVDFIYRVPLVLQRLNQRRAELALFQFGRAVAAAEVGQADGALRVEVPVEQADRGFGYVFDDLRAAR